MSNKYYKVIKENFIWEVGAILERSTLDDGYKPIDSIFNMHDDTNEYISTRIVENSPDYFVRVYPVSLASKVVYRVKEEAKELIFKQYK
jgi:hypothetical protein